MIQKIINHPLANPLQQQARLIVTQTECDRCYRVNEHFLLYGILLTGILPKSELLLGLKWRNSRMTMFGGNFSFQELVIMFRSTVIPNYMTYCSVLRSQSCGIEGHNELIGGYIASKNLPSKFNPGLSKNVRIQKVVEKLLLLKKCYRVFCWVTSCE